MKDYDPDRCITAAELRAMGVKVPAQIPDCAWVPRASIRFGDVQCKPGVDRTTMRARVSIYLTVPFQWVEFSMELPASS